MPVRSISLTEKSTRLYQKYVQSLESKHYGEYVAVSTDGRIVFAKTLVEVMQNAERELGSGNFVFKVGDIAVGKWL